MIAAMGLLCFPAKAQDNMMPNIKSWPEASQMAAKDMMDKYGKPNETTPHMLVWYNNGPWKKTTIYDVETTHIFPVDHTDVMEQVIDYKVPLNKFSALAEYDGSVSVHRTDGNELNVIWKLQIFWRLILPTMLSPVKKQCRLRGSFMQTQLKNLFWKKRHLPT